MQKRTIWITTAAGAVALALGGTAIAFAATDGFDTDDDRVVAASTTGGEATALGTTAPRTEAPSTTAPGTTAPVDDNGGDRADGVSDDVPGTPGGDNLVGDEFTRATAAALEATGGGTVTEAERSDDGDDDVYEVEIRLDNGAVVDVELDAAFAVLRVEQDD